MTHATIARDLLDAGPFGVAQDAIVARLKAAFPPGRFNHDFVPAKLDRAAWDRHIKGPQFIGLGWVGYKPAENCGDTLQGDARWTLYLVVKNGAGEHVRLRGDKYNAGLLPMLRVALTVMHGWTIKGVGAVRVTGSANSFHPEVTGEDFALHLVDVVVRTPIDDREALAALPDFLRLGEAWPFDPADTSAPTTITEVRG